MKTLLLFLLSCAGVVICSAVAIDNPLLARDERNTDPNSGSVNNEAHPVPIIEVLRGRDGRDGRDGAAGKPGPRGVSGPQGERGPVGATGPPGPRGVVYTRWGRTTCPSTTGTELLYHGITAGSWYSHTGGGANYLCLPRDPQFLSFRAGEQSGWRNLLYGTEYDLDSGDPLTSSINDGQNAPCAVCHASSQAAVVMIPAKITCPSSWRVEYVGYLMSAFHGHQRTTYKCVDRNAESIPGSAVVTDGAIFHHTEVRCNGIPCPPYDAAKEVTCVVCTK